MRVLRPDLHFLALVAYASVVLAGLEGHELCLGLDGHVALEVSDHRCCTARTDHDAGDALSSQWAGGSRGCGDCVHIPLSFASADHHAPQGRRALNGTSALPGSQAGAALLPQAAQPSCLCLSGLDSLSPPPRSVPALSLRSVVLRI